MFTGFEGADSASDLFGIVCIVNILFGACPVYTGLLALVAPDFQMANSRQVLAAFVDVLPVLDELGLERQLQGHSIVASLRRGADDIHHEVEVAPIAQHRHVEERGDGALFLVDADVDFVVVSVVVGQPFEQPHFDAIYSPTPSFEAELRFATLPSWLDMFAIVRS